MLFIAHYAAKKHSRLGNNVSFTTRVHERVNEQTNERVAWLYTHSRTSVQFEAKESGVIWNASNEHVLLFVYRVGSL